MLYWGEALNESSPLKLVTITGTQTSSVAANSNIYPSCMPNVSGTFLIAVTKYLVRSEIKKFLFCLVHSLWVKSAITEGKARQQEHEPLVALRTQLGRKDRWSLYLAYSLLFIQSGILALSNGGVHSWGGSSHFQYPNLEIPSQMYPQMCLLNDYRFCPVDNQY